MNGFSFPYPYENEIRNINDEQLNNRIKEYKEIYNNNIPYYNNINNEQIMGNNNVTPSENLN